MRRSPQRQRIVWAVFACSQTQPSEFSPLEFLLVEEMMTNLCQGIGLNPSQVCGLLEVLFPLNDRACCSPQGSMIHTNFFQNFRQ